MKESDIAELKDQLNLNDYPSLLTQEQATKVLELFEATTLIDEIAKDGSGSDFFY